MTQETLDRTSEHETKQATPTDLNRLFDDTVEKMTASTSGSPSSLTAELMRVPTVFHYGKPEDYPFIRLTRTPGPDGSIFYWSDVVPGNGRSNQTITFRGDKVLVKRKVHEQIGTDSWEDREEEGELSADEIQKMYEDLADPSVESREDFLEWYYKDKHSRRSKVGRAIAKARKTDRPRPTF